MTRVKICGNTHVEDIAICVEEGADAVGVVVEYPVPVPWSVARGRAAALMREIPPLVTSVAVVGGDVDTMLRVAEATSPDALQLHGDEPEEVVAALRDRLGGTGIHLIKAVSVEPRAGDGVTAWLTRAERFVTAGADAILLDAKPSDRAGGGSGTRIDWSLARAISGGCSRPVILAGGLTPANIGTAIHTATPYAVDAISSVEDASHRKVRDSVRAFIRAAHGADR